MAGDRRSNVVEEQKRLYLSDRDRSGHVEYVRTAQRCSDYYVGKQWDEKTLAKLHDRPALTLNVVLSTINTMLGEQSSTRGDVQFKPRRGEASAKTASALTQLWLQIADNNELEWREAEMFGDGIVTGRGYYDVRLDFSDHIRGEVRVTTPDPMDVVLDPDAKEYDPKTWSRVTCTRWVSVDDVEALYGASKANDLMRSVQMLDFNDAFFQDSVRIDYRNTFGGEERGRDELATLSENELRSHLTVRLVERQHYKMRKTRFFVSREFGDMRAVPDEWSAEKTAEFEAKFGLYVLEVPSKRVRWTVTASDVLLHDEWSPYDTFTVIPFFAYYRRGRPFGVVENLLSPQDLLNKTASQELHVVNTTANSGWQVESGSLVNMTVDELEERGAETGLVIERAKGSNPLEKIQPNQIPAGLDRISVKAVSILKEISGVNDSLRGLDKSEVSGVAIQAKAQRGMVQMQVPRSNLARTRYYLAQKVLEIVQKYYNEERVYQVVDTMDPERGTSELRVNAVDENGAPWNDLTAGEYMVSVANTPARDTFNDSQLAEAISLRQAGVVIPDYKVVEYSNLAQKHEVAKLVQKITGLAEPSEEEVQAAQQQLELQQRAQLLSLQQAEATVGKLIAETELAKAKAQDLTEDDKGGGKVAVEAQVRTMEAEKRFEAEMARIQAELRKHREALEVQVDELRQKREIEKDKIAASIQVARMRPKPTAPAAGRK